MGWLCDDDDDDVNFPHEQLWCLQCTVVVQKLCTGIVFDGQFAAHFCWNHYYPAHHAHQLVN